MCYWTRVLLGLTKYEQLALLIGGRSCWKANWNRNSSKRSTKAKEKEFSEPSETFWAVCWVRGKAKEKWNSMSSMKTGNASCMKENFTNYTKADCTNSRVNSSSRVRAANSS